jgi:ubiquinol-cytochrome c reductase cytochrome b subunit
MTKLFSKIMTWVDDRYPLSDFLKEHLTGYYAPKNFNFWYYFGVLSLVIFVSQIATGIWLTMNYNPSAEGAFASVEYIMRDVPFGWLLRYMHSTGASFFFIVIYLHMFRGILYGSYKKPRELVWLVGMAIYLCLMAEAFFGYLLPWGNMSFWGAQVITSLFSAVPWVGDKLVEFIRGDYNVTGVTLNRFFALHVILVPFIMAAFVAIHIFTLHNVGSNNPDGVDIKHNKNANGIPLDGIAFHPYYTVKDLFGISIFLILFAIVIFYNPEFGGLFLESANFTTADPMKTPASIAPVWYMTPYYAILRAIPNKLFGVVAMGCAVLVFFFLPWLDKSPVRSIRYKGTLSKIAIAVFVISFLSLGYLGVHEPTPVRNIFARLFTFTYFSFFVLMPIYTRIEKTKPVPERVTK